MLRPLALGTLLLSLLAFPAAGNATSLKDVQVGLRTVDFMTDPPHGKTEVAVIFDPRNKESTEDAHAIEGWLGGALRLAKVELVPSLVDVHSLARAPGFRVAVLAAGVGEYYDRILDYARKHATLTISADLDCVRANRCTVGVAITPRVEVIVSRQVSTSCGIDFLDAFRMMVTEY